jgi:hypothetical protein
VLLRAELREVMAFSLGKSNEKERRKGRKIRT